MARVSPQLVFFCELEAVGQRKLFDQPTTLNILSKNSYGIALAIREFTPEQAAVVRTLNAHSIPLTAWLLLPKEAGYWVNVDNYPQTIAQYHMFQEWARTERLSFVAVGLDMQSPPALRDTLSTVHPVSIYQAIVAARNNALFPAAYEAYHDLVTEIHLDGYAVHLYQFPFVMDDRRAGTTLVQRTLNVVALPVDVEVLLCYSSLVPRRLGGNRLGTALIAEYGVYADAIGIGSTGSSASVHPTHRHPAAPLTWNDLVRDLQQATEYTETIYLHSLEGCVEQGYLARLADTTRQPTSSLPLRYGLVARLIRQFINIILWWSWAGLTFMGWLGWVVVAIIMIRRLFDRMRRSRQ
jgi:hypothetical protein